MKLITVKGAAELLQVSERTIRRYIKEGVLEAYQPYGKGGAIRIIWRNDGEVFL